MTRLKDQLHWKLRETPRGARITVTADNKESLDAVHEFLRFQIDDHKTGDFPWFTNLPIFEAHSRAAG
jgi:hypothetical protein